MIILVLGIEDDRRENSNSIIEDTQYEDNDSTSDELVDVHLMTAL